MLKLNLLLCALSHFNSDAGRQARRAWAAIQFDFTAWGGNKIMTFMARCSSWLRLTASSRGIRRWQREAPNPQSYKQSGGNLTAFDGSTTSVVPRNKQQAKNYQGFQHTQTHTQWFLKATPPLDSSISREDKSLKAKPGHLTPQCHYKVTSAADKIDHGIQSTQWQSSFPKWVPFQSLTPRLALFKSEKLL